MTQPTVSYKLKLQRPTDIEDTGDSSFSGDSGVLRETETKETKATHDSAVAPSVFTVQQAVELALSGPIDENAVFRFCRALRTLEQNTGVKLTKREHVGIFHQWWIRANHHLEFDDQKTESWYLVEFAKSFPKARVPLGDNALQRATKLADNNPPPDCCDGFTGSVARLLAVCWHLNAGGLFYMGVRDAAEILGSKDKMVGASMMEGLVNLGVIQILKKGVAGGRKATLYSFTNK